MKAAAVSGERTVAADDAMTRYHDGDRIIVIRHSHIARGSGFPDGPCDISVRAGLSIRNSQKFAPYRQLKWGSFHIQPKIKMSSLSLEIFPELLRVRLVHF